MSVNDGLKLRRCLLEPIPELFIAAKLLSDSIDALLLGERTKAEELLLKTDTKEIFEWSETLFGGKSIPKSVRDAVFTKTIDPNKPPVCPSEQRASANIPKALKNKILHRDGYFCRYCGIPVIDQDAMGLIKQHFRSVLRDGDRNVDKHAALQALDLDFDHIIPRCLGGRNTCENLIVACSPCNTGKWNYTLAEHMLDDPRNFSPSIPVGFDPWDGLIRIKSLMSKK